MTSPGSKKPDRPAVVRRSRPADKATAGPSTGRPKTAHDEPAGGTDASIDAATAPAARKSADRKPATERKAAAGRQAAPQKTSRSTTAAPKLSASMYAAAVPVDGAGRVLVRVAGLLAAVGALLVAVSGHLPYVVLDGQDVSAPVNVWSVLAHLLILFVGVGGGALLLAGRGGRVGLALISAAAALAPGYLLLAIHHATGPDSHDLAEYYFGELHTTITMEGQSGRLLAIAGWALLLLAGCCAIAAWRQVPESDLLPLGAARSAAGGAAALSILLAVIAYLLPAGLTRIEKYTDPYGFSVTRDMVEPKSLLAAGGLGFAGGVVLLLGLLVAGAIIGAMSSRVTVVAALAGLSAMLLFGALENLRDMTAGENLVPGPRFYLLLVAGLITASAAAYSATVRQREQMTLLSDQSESFS